MQTNFSVIHEIDTAESSDLLFWWSSMCIGGLSPKPNIHSISENIFISDALDLIKTIDANYKILWSRSELIDGMKMILSAVITIKTDIGIVMLSFDSSYSDQGPFENYTGSIPTKYASSYISIAFDPKFNTDDTIKSDATILRIQNTLALKFYKKRKKNSISILCKNDNGLYVKTLPMDSKYGSIDLSTHYGSTFPEYDKALKRRMSETNKGIILFHGDPGTGKSYYIRHLIGTIENKLVLYVPSSMISMLSSPGFSDFLLSWIEDNNEESVFDEKEKKNGVLLVMEDAEKALIRRDINAYSDEVSAILNSADGIMNDFLSIQIVATFNVDMELIDPAVLRKRRAISIKSFGKLSKEDAKNLAVSLNVDPEKINTEKTLAEVYEMSDETSENEILFSYDESKGKVGFGR